MSESGFELLKPKALKAKAWIPKLGKPAMSLALSSGLRLSL